MKTSRIPVNAPVDNRNYSKLNYLIGKWALIASIVYGAVYVYCSVRSTVKKPGHVMCAHVKRLRLARTKDTCKALQYLSFINKGETPVSFLGIRLKLSSLTRKKFEIDLDADSVATDGKMLPITALEIANTPLTGNFNFSTSVDSAELSNMPVGYYDCIIQGIVDSTGRAIDLNKYTIYLDEHVANSFRGMRRHIKKHNHRRYYMAYPTLELNTN